MGPKTSNHQRAFDLMIEAAGLLSGSGEYVFLVRASKDEIQVKDVTDTHFAKRFGEVAQRRRVTEDRLLAIADAYKAGGIAGVMDVGGVTERQAWRLKRRAVEAGYLPSSDN